MTSATSMVLKNGDSWRIERARCARRAEPAPALALAAKARRSCIMKRTGGVNRSQPPLPHPLVLMRFADAAAAPIGTTALTRTRLHSTRGRRARVQEWRPGHGTMNEHFSNISHKQRWGRHPLRHFGCRPAPSPLPHRKNGFGKNHAAAQSHRAAHRRRPRPRLPDQIQSTRQRPVRRAAPGRQQQHHVPAFDLEKFTTKWDEDLVSLRYFRQN